MKNENQKLKLLYLKEILMRETDENHSLSAAQLEERLDRLGIKSERKSIYSDINAMCDAGILDVERTKGKNGGFRVLSRDFELAELKMLVDAVQSSRFISGKQCRELIKKLSALTCVYEEKQLSRSVYIYDREEKKHSNVLYSVDALHNAISANSVITFKYTEMTPSKKRVARKNGESYEVSPWGLIWQDENYYLVAYDHISDEIRHYRVDKMDGIAETGEKRKGKEEFEAISLADYCSKVFGMFSGKEYNVRFRCKSSLAGAMFDRFGTSLVIEEKGEYFEFYAKVEVSVRFFGWVFGFDGGLEILSPECVLDEYKAQLTRALKM